jgi:hypothetical protein
VSYNGDLGYYMSPNAQVYKQPAMYNYGGKPSPNAYHRKHSEGSALIKPIGMKANSGFKQNSLKKQNGRKRVFSTNETSFGFDQKFKQFSGNLSNTKDSSTSSTNKYGPGGQMSGSPQEPKSLYLIKLRQCIKDKEDHNIAISDLKDHVSEISQDQYGSRFIQRVYESASSEEK